MDLPQLPPDKFQFLPCEGGCDFVTPPMLQKPGRLRACINLEIGVNGGYDTLKGYERYDGRASPSAALYTVLPVNITGTVAVGNTVTGATSAATGKVIAVVSTTSIIITQYTGTFTSSENLTVSAVVQATMTSSPVAGGAPTPALNATYLNLAADVYRALITVVPGEGPIRGIARLDGVLYAWRNAVGGASMAIYKSSGSGWTAVDLGREVAFTSGGTYEIVEGNTITGATSGATAAITRVVLQSGAWADGDAAGYLVFASQTGTFQAENLNVGANLNVATIPGNSSAITLSPSGRVKIFIYNFGGQSGTKRIYGCDGVNLGFEFSGTVYVRIRTGMTVDVPTNVICHKQHLFFSFGSSAQHSGTGYPYVWEPIFGAAEIAVGDTITGFSIEMSIDSGGAAALGILCRNSVNVLYGNYDLDWNLIKYRDEIGAYENSIQNIGNTVMIDDSGVVMLKAVNAYGNFGGVSLSKLIQPFIQSRKYTVTDSCLCREKNQVRFFFNDESALYVTFDSKGILGMMTEQLEHKVTCIHSTEGTNAGEEIFFGSDDGYCYQMERGTSFDGEAIECFGMFEYFNLGSPRLNKTYKGATVEATGSGYAVFSLGWELGFSSEYIAQPTSQATADDFESISNFLATRWDLGNWDSGYWDGVSVSPSNFKLVGTAENIGYILYSNSDEYNPVHFSGIMTRYQPRRILRA